MQFGIQIGMSLGEARSLLGPTGRSPQSKARRPLFQKADPAADLDHLRRLAFHCQRYSPLAGMEESTEPECLWLDIAGNEEVFGGERRLADAIRTDFARQGFQVRTAIADTWGAAWAISHFTRGPSSIVRQDEQPRMLAPLPIAALRVAAAVVESLDTLGVQTIGRLMQLPRSSLPSRFGPALLRRLDQALGHAAELLAAERPVEPIVALRTFEDAVSDLQVLQHVLGELLDQVLQQVNTVALRELNCLWLGTTTAPITLRLLRPTRDRKHLFELLRLHSERCRFETGVTGVRLEVVDLGLPAIHQRRLFDADDTDQQQDIAELVDRLRSRTAVLQPVLTPDPQPEYACESTPWQGEPRAGDQTTARSQLRCRPLRLLRRPQRLIFDAMQNGLPLRLHQQTVVRISGPERIETGWWRGADIARDYYRLELSDGADLWVFLDRQTDHWFLHGQFD
jgi:protein ImuB